MVYQALYRKYRPKTFSDVIGQEHITKTLQNEISEDKTVHAYLFTGSRGTGKTTCAKILAKAINCKNHNDGDPCLQCDSCNSIEAGENTDIVEIDAASNTGVDNIRELIDLVGFTPSTSKYRVIIIDEVHMLSQGAFNALLKTLEEPPSYIVFILATTEVHKLPSTIISRCQRFDFRRIDNNKISERIKTISEAEGLAITDDAATLIATAADGGMRDALSILDLCASTNKNIDESTVETVCAMAGNEYLLEITEYIKSRNTEKALQLIDSLHNSSVDMLRLLSELTSHYRDLMIVKTIKDKNRPIICTTARMDSLEQQAADYELSEIMYALGLLQSAFTTMQSGNRRCALEMVIIKLCNPSLSVDIESLERRISILENGNFSNTVVKPVVIEEEPDEPQTIENDVVEENQIIEKENFQADKPIDKWKDILKILSETCPLIAGVLKNSTAYINGNYLLIDCDNSQFRSLINSGNPYYKDSIRNAAFKILGNSYKLGPYQKKDNKEIDQLSVLANKLKNLEIN